MHVSDIKSCFTFVDFLNFLIRKHMNDNFRKS